ncbi:MAG TPA: hypothetical protein VE175_13880 [Woeseiaceae bacterium]|nr:hypothetical protein [Woeseiaceae bacterium]
MQAAGLFPTLKVLSWIVLLLMLVAGGYTFAISLIQWSGIGV